MPGDFHAHAVKWGLSKIGVSAKILYPLDLADGARWSWRAVDDALAVSYKGAVDTIRMDSFDTIWLRRTTVTIPQAKIQEEIERSNSETEFKIFVQSLYERLGLGKFVVNPFGANTLAGLKPLQLNLAAKSGFKVPNTLVSNDKEEIVSFLASNQSGTIFKPMKLAYWNRGERGITTVPTTLITADLIARSDLTSSAQLFQEHIPKIKEIRATIMGQSTLAWEKTFPDRENLDVDWRLMHVNAHLKPHNLPDDVERACFRLMRSLGIVFGCFDFIVDEANDYYFLEVNPQGQWLWGDTLGLPLNHLEAMVDFLAEADPAFVYRKRNRLSLEKFVEEDNGKHMAEESEQHFGNVMTHMYRSANIPIVNQSN
jgi:glutathione synthase/RimK-type ligase-like ATP-grasp enzyme